MDDTLQNSCAHNGLQLSKSERSPAMGDTKGKKEKAKEQKQHDAKQANSQQRRQDKQHPAAALGKAKR